jgi:hypothetical protein
MSSNFSARATPAALVTALGAVVAITVTPTLPALTAAVRLLAWIHLMLLPGVGLYLWLQRTGRNTTDAALAGLAVSPVLLAGVASLSLVAGVREPVFLGVLIGATVLLIIAGAGRRAEAMARPPAREAWAFIALLAVTIVLVAALPATREWWRVRSDAWFHGAVVLEMRDLGTPPEDPYFAGMGLQYMWAYHALVLTLGRALRLDYFWVMAVLNWQALAMLSVAAYRLAAVFRPHTAHRIAAVATTLFAFNAAFWVFLPIKAGRALLGDVRGTEELVRTFSLTPLHYLRSYDVLSVLGAPPFFLDKYMVATAFGIAVSYLLAALAAGSAYLSRPGRGMWMVLCASIAGTLLFHTYVGLVAVGASLGAATALFLFPRAVRNYAPRMSLSVAAAVVLAVVLTAPFIYSVTHLKDSGGESLLGLSMHRAIAIVIPCSLVLVLAWRERHLRQDSAPAARFLQYFAVLTLLACLAIRLPGANDTAKPPFLVFVSLAVVAGFAIADSCLAQSGWRRFRLAAMWIVLFAIPCNAIALAGCFGTPDETVVTPPEHAVAVWSDANTGRRDVIIDEPGHVFLLVAGPRRYLFGSWPYASQWKYPRAEMARRYHTVQSLFDPEPLDSTALGALAAAPEPLWVIVRPEARAAGAIVARRDDLFPLAYEAGEIQVRAVDRFACRVALQSAAGGPSEKELIRASGL